MIAVDIAILLPADIRWRMIGLSKDLSKKKKTRIRLSKTGCLPHITLLMGTLPRRNISDMLMILKDTLATEKPFMIKRIAANAKRAGVELEKNRAISRLQSRLERALRGQLSNHVNEDMFFRKGSESINPRTLSYVKRFAIDSSEKNYQPHITIDSGSRKIPFYPLVFTCSHIAVCHLGNFCTCRKILGAIRL